jgi:cell fate regulator YaaT (PSP1 superfamily)
MKQVMPRVGSQVSVEAGVTAIVRGLNVISETVLLEIEGRDSYLEVKLTELSNQTQAEQKSAKNQVKTKPKK